MANTLALEDEKSANAQTESESKKKLDDISSNKNDKSMKERLESKAKKKQKDGILVIDDNIKIKKEPEEEEIFTVHKVKKKQKDDILVINDNIRIKQEPEEEDIFVVHAKKPAKKKTFKNFVSSLKKPESFLVLDDDDDDSDIIFSEDETKPIPLEELLKRQAQLNENICMNMAESIRDSHKDENAIDKELFEVSTNADPSPEQTELAEPPQKTEEELKKEKEKTDLEDKKALIEALQRLVRLKKEKLAEIKSEIEEATQSSHSKIEGMMTKIKGEVECNICFEYYGSFVLDRTVEAVIVLPCCHTFCTQCLGDHADGNNNKDSCPTCRKKILYKVSLGRKCNLETLGLVFSHEFKKRYG